MIRGLRGTDMKWGISALWDLLETNDSLSVCIGQRRREPLELGAHDVWL